MIFTTAKALRRLYGLIACNYLISDSKMGVMQSNFRDTADVSLQCMMTMQSLFEWFSGQHPATKITQPVLGPRSQ